MSHQRPLGKRTQNQRTTERKQAFFVLGFAIAATVFLLACDQLGTYLTAVGQ